VKRFTTDGYQIAYRDEGRGPVVVFVHGTPSSSAEFAAVIDALCPEYRCIAVDHLGFGQSDKPEVADYSIDAHRRRLAALLGHLDIARFHLVAHDFGGAIALPLAMADPRRVVSLTLMNTWLWPLVDTEPAMRVQLPLLRSRLMAWLYRRFNLSARVLVKAAWGTHRPLTTEQHQRYMAPFSTPAERTGTIAFLKALVDAAESSWQRWRDLEALAEVPTLVLWGMGDKMVTPKTLQRWRALVPAAKIIELPRVGHFAADEAPELVSDLLRRFLADDTRLASSRQSA
jgi:haloalkane dehalogenase